MRDEAFRACEGKRDRGKAVGIAAQRSKGRRRIAAVVGWRASRRGPRSVDTRVGTRRAEKSTGTGKPGGYRGRRFSRTSPIFHEVVTPDGLSLSGCLLYPSCGRKSSVKSLRPASSCPPLPLSFSFSFALRLPRARRKRPFADLAWR